MFKLKTILIPLLFALLLSVSGVVIVVQAFYSWVFFAWMGLLAVCSLFSPINENYLMGSTQDDS